MTAISCYILADTFFVAQGLGSNGLAALNLAIPAYNVIYGIGLMLGMGGATKFSICQSQNDQKHADEMFTHTIGLAALFAAVGFLFGLFGSEWLTGILGADETIFSMTNVYLKVMCLFSPAILLNAILVCYVRNDGNPRLSMLATMGSSFSNIILDYVFIFPCGMGMFGAIFATGLAQVMGVLIMLPHCLKTSRGFHLTPGKVRGKVIGTHFSLGFPSFLAQLASGIVIVVFNLIILKLTGNIGVAAYGVIANIALVVTAVYTGIAQGMQPLVSDAYGRNEKTEMSRYLRYGMITMVLASGLMYAVLFLFADPITQVFNSENSRQLQEIAVPGLRIYFISAVFVGANTVLSMYFTSVEQVLPAHIISLLHGVVVIIPMAFLLSALWGMTGVWLAFPLTELLVSLVGAWLFIRQASSGSFRSRGTH